MALAFGAPSAGVTSARPPAEGKQADQADCIRMQQQIARTNRGIDVAKDRIDKADAARREAEFNRDRVIDKIKRLATKLGLDIVPRIGNLNDVIGELYELPAASGSDVRTVVNLIDEALTLDSARKEAEADVKKLLKLHGDLLEVLRELQAAYDAQCPVA